MEWKFPSGASSCVIAVPVNYFMKDDALDDPNQTHQIGNFASWGKGTGWQAEGKGGGLKAGKFINCFDLRGAEGNGVGKGERKKNVFVSSWLNVERAIGDGSLASETGSRATTRDGVRRKRIVCGGWGLDTRARLYLPSMIGERVQYVRVSAELCCSFELWLACLRFSWTSCNETSTDKKLSPTYILRSVATCLEYVLHSV